MSAVMHGEMRPDGSSNRRLTCAIGASLALHGVILFVGMPPREPASRDLAPNTITARLVSPPPPASPAPQAMPSVPQAAAPPAESEPRARKAEVPPQPKKRKPLPKPSKPAVATSKPSQEAPRPAAAPSDRTAPKSAQPPVDPSGTSPASSRPEPTETPAPSATPPADVAPSAPAQAAQETGSLEAYRRDLLGMAARYKRYPLVARDNNWEGMATVRLAIGANGMIASISIAQSSGHEVLDRAALEMIRKAKGAVPIPSALQGKPFVISIPVLYEIKDPGLR